MSSLHIPRAGALAAVWFLAAAVLALILMLIGVSPLVVVATAGVAAIAGTLVTSPSHPARSVFWFSVAGGLGLVAALPALRLLALML